MVAERVIESNPPLGCHDRELPRHHREEASAHHIVHPRWHTDAGHRTVQVGLRQRAVSTQVRRRLCPPLRPSAAGRQPTANLLAIYQVAFGGQRDAFHSPRRPDHHLLWFST